MAEEHVNVEFSLKDSGILYPYVRAQLKMRINFKQSGGIKRKKFDVKRVYVYLSGEHVCYAYSTTEAVSALFARDKNREPIELSIQQIADHVPIDFRYASKDKETDTTGCYLGSHIHALRYAQYFGLCTKDDYPTRGYRPKDVDIPPVPRQKLRYQIESFTRVRTEDSDIRYVTMEEDLVSEEEINDILERQPMIGAIRIFQSFQDFKGKGVYMGCTGDDDEDLNAGHSVLVVGHGVKAGTKYFVIKNSCGVEWGDEGYGRVRRDLLYRLCYPNNVFMFPYDPIDRKVEKTAKDNPKGSGSKKKKGC